jgi:hypothetical protein
MGASDGDASGRKRRALAMAPLLAELRDRGMCLSQVATELDRVEIETPKGGSRWNTGSVRMHFIWSGVPLPIKGVPGPKPQVEKRVGLPRTMGVKGHRPGARETTDVPPAHHLSRRVDMLSRGVQ